MHPDSLNKDYTVLEDANLDVTPEGSVFYSSKTIARDSLFSRMRQTRGFNRTQMQDLRSKIDYVVTKNYADQSISYEGLIGMDSYSYTETQPFEWKIQSDTMTIGDYRTQKAETNFGGRTWTVWFAPEVPFFDGPYKFSGLPGLIVKAEDDKGDYSFDLAETKKIAQPYVLNTSGFGRQTIKIDKKKFGKVLADYRKDPIAFIQASFANRGFRMQNNRGRNTQREAQLKKELEENNNPIELK